jgi:hypothetical protein
MKIDFWKSRFIKILLILLIANFSIALSPAFARTAPPAWNAGFTYHHWELRTLLRTSEDESFFNDNIQRWPEDFRVRVRGESVGAVRIEARGMSFAVTYSELGRKYAINGQELNISPGSNFAEIHKEVQRILAPGRHAISMGLFEPEAQAIEPALTAMAGMVIVDLWLASSMAASLCFSDRYPGGNAPEGKEILHFLGGPVALYFCSKNKTLGNVHCPSNIEQAISIELQKNNMQVERDKSGKPILVSVIGKNGKKIFTGKVDEPGPGGWGRVRPVAGTVFPPHAEVRDDEIMRAIYYASLYCAVRKDEDVEKFSDALKSMPYAFPEGDEPEDGTKAAH